MQTKKMEFMFVKQRAPLKKTYLRVALDETEIEREREKEIKHIMELFTHKPKLHEPHGKLHMQTIPHA